MTLHVLNPPETGHFYAPQPTKFGAYASNSLQVAFWFLKPGQEIPLKKSPDADEVYTVLEGEGEFLAYDFDVCELPGTYIPSATTKVLPPNRPDLSALPPPSKLAIGPGCVVVAESNRFHAIRNSGDANLLISAVVAPTPVGQVFVSR